MAQPIGVRWAYRSVMPNSRWPRISCTSLRLRPRITSHDAQVCRRSWHRPWPRPATLAGRFLDQVQYVPGRRFGIVRVMEGEALRELMALVRRKLADGRLPQDSIPRVWGGPGHGELCDACELAIGANQLVMEGVSTDDGKQGIQFHVRCFYLWDSLRTVPVH